MVFFAKNQRLVAFARANVSVEARALLRVATGDAAGRARSIDMQRAGLELFQVALSIKVGVQRLGGAQRSGEPTQKQLITQRARRVR